MSGVSSSESSSNRARVLCVDDELDLLHLLRLQICEFYDVEVASDAEQALQLMSTLGPFDAVVSDMRMPRVNGAEFLARVRAEYPSTVRILLTGDGDLNSAIRAVNEGNIFRYLTKPCLRDKVLEALRDACVEHQRLQSTEAQPQGPGLGGTPANTNLVNRSAASSSGAIELGNRIGGRYELSRVIGQGAQATVFEALDLTLGQPVALKVFVGAADSDTSHRIKRELIVARQLSHPNIVRLHDIGTHEGNLFLSMELLDGEDLRGLVERGRLEIPYVLGLLRQACEGLAHAHARDITHRDVKPENLFLMRNGTLRLTDFGLAKHLPSAGITAPGTIAGTFTYMAPEQMEGLSHATCLTDIYALGAVGYELLTGRPPFVHGDPLSLMALHMAASVESPSEFRPDIPEELDQLILCSLSKQPEERIQTCTAFARVLARISDGFRRRAG